MKKLLGILLLVILLPTIINANTRLIYIGHSSFEWTTPNGTKIIIDPYGNSIWVHWFDQEFPPLGADIVIVTHPHYDHDAVFRVKGNPLIINSESLKKGSDYYIQGITGRHARYNKYGSRNLIFLLEIDGIRFCHWGDNDADISDNLLRELGRVDVLFLPVDESEHLLTMTEVAKVIDRLAPKVVIPIHYYIPGLTSPCSTLQPIDHWLSQQNIVHKIPGTGVELSADNLPATREVWVFERVSLSTSMPNSLIRCLPCIMQISGTWLILLALLIVACVAVWFRYLRRTRISAIGKID